jgi:mRNA interferase HicA
VKRLEFIKRLEALGFRFKRHGNRHDIYVRGNETEEVPRHGDINERLAKSVLSRREPEFTYVYSKRSEK